MTLTKGKEEPRDKLMDNYKIEIYTHSADMPDVQGEDFFHSAELFRMYEQTPRHKPLMVVTLGKGGVQGHMLAVVSYKWGLMPPYLYAHCRVIGEGDYCGTERQREAMFGAMLNALTRKLRHRALYVEFSNLSRKMFGYKEFRRAGYFPVHWMSIHNSLHSRTPEERISPRMMRHIKHAAERGVTTREVDGEDDLQVFARLMKAHNKWKPRRHTPDETFFRRLQADSHARLFITQHKGRTIGCCACVYWGGNAYVWHLASLRKSYVTLHPDVATVWAVIKHAHAHGYAHINFMDVGLPFRRNRFREFILRFGGKPVSSYRWFMVNIGWVNRLLKWIYFG